MRINQNITAFNAYRNLSQTQDGLGKSLEKLSSGFRINRAADDAAGLVNSENLRSQIGGLKVATRNAQDAISLVQTAEGAQTEVHAILQRMRDLAVQSGNLGTNDTAALQANQDEINELVQELNRIADQTQFGTLRILNGDLAGTAAQAATAATATLGTVDEGDLDFSGTSLDFDISVDGGAAQNISLNGDYADGDALLAALNGAVSGATFSIDDDGDLVVTSDTTGDSSSVEITNTAGAAGSGVQNQAEVTGSDAVEATGGAVFQVGANAGQTVRVQINGVSAAELGVDSLDVTDEAGVNAALGVIDTAIGSVSSNRAELGAFQNRMESTIRNVSVAVENLSAAESRIRDADMALEMVEFTRNQILQQAGTAMLAQANLVPQSVLSLLR